MPKANLGHLRAVQITKDARHISDVMLPGMVVSTRCLLRCMTGGRHRFETGIRPGEPVRKKLVPDIQH